MKMKQLIFLFLVFFVVTGFSQEVLLKEIPNDTIIPLSGPNLRHYHYFWLSYTLPPVNASSNAKTSAPGSYAFELGFRNKRKLSECYAVGYDLSFRIASYSMKNKNYGEYNWNSRRYKTGSLNGDIFQRFNFDKRGNMLGTFADIGIFGGWNVLKVHSLSRKSEDGEPFKTVELIEHRLDYIEPFTYGVLFRAGKNHILFTASYRLSKLVKTNNELYLGELPRLNVGVELGLF